MQIPPTKKLTHPQKKTNYWESLALLFGDFHLLCFLKVTNYPHDAYSSPQGGPTISNEADSVKYCDYVLLLLLFHLLQQYPQFRFYSKIDVSLIIYLDEMDDGEGDSAT